MKKGFTLIELLAVISILAVIILIASTFILNILEKSKIEAYKNNEKMFIKAAETYLANNQLMLPILNNKIEISLDTLVTNKFITSIKDPKDNSDCTGYIVVSNIEGSIIYTPNLRCDTTVNNSSEDNLVLHYTFDDFQEPTVNLIPGGSLNAYPKIGNGHNTYDTTQYNGNVYFSIGTIGNITNNIVTLSAVTIPIYTYDVLTPQTTGGGVTAGVDYYIKKLSPTTFTLHQYDNTGDGSKGFRVYDSINNDIRININSTNFPTMWVGKPHMHNRSVVKEIIPNCFSSTSNIKHECIRLYTSHKPDGGEEGMAYGVYPPVTIGETYTYSFYYRGFNDYSVGQTLRASLYTTAGWSIPNATKSISSKENWDRYVVTSTSPGNGGTNMYIHPKKLADVEISEIQFEPKTYATPFTETSRVGIIKNYASQTNTATLALATTPRWINNNYLFDGVNDLIQTDNTFLLNTSKTYSAWIYPTNLTGLKGIVGNHTNTIPSNIGLNQLDDKLSVSIGYTDGTREFSDKLSTKSLTLNSWNHVMLIHDTTSNKIKFYLNGKFDCEHILSKSINYTSEKILIGQWSNTYLGFYTFSGNIDNVQIFNRILSDNEIEAIYNTNISKY